MTPNADTGRVINAAFRYLPEKRKPHYRGEPWFDWLEIEYHLSQYCAMENHDICNQRGWGYRCPRMPLGYCECVCHSASSNCRSEP